ncbi:MAG: urate hydroxylase PuuD [Pseudomonadota bacterium]
MEAQIFEWLNLLLRFLHVVTGIAWIGASFYFIWLDLSLEQPSEEKAKRGLGGELWSIHGGGIYEVGKYKLSPAQMPETLHWFKWEAYSTWLTGTALMIVYYYWRADTQLIGAEGWLSSPTAGVLASIAYLLGGLALYEGFMRWRVNASFVTQMAAILVLLCFGSWLAFELFSSRAAILHVGAMLGTIMAANVFLVIIPSQKSLVNAIDKGEPPDAAHAALAKNRSTHNNYLTLPVLFCMLSNHAPFVFGHPYAWILVAAISASAMVARQFFNAKHTGNVQPGYLIGPSIALILIAIIAGATANTNIALPDEPVDTVELQTIITKHCATCHSEMPTQPGFTAPPGGHLFRTPEDIDKQAALALTSLQSNYMPLGNLTGMTQEERAKLMAWASRGE